MRRLKLLAIGLVLAMVLGLTVSSTTSNFVVMAQDDSPTDSIYFAHDPDAGRLVDFRMDGNTPQIVVDTDGLTSRPRMAMQLDSQTVFMEMGIGRDEPVQYFIITADDMEMLDLDSMLPSEAGGYEIIAHHAPYIVIQPILEIFAVSEKLLYNYETRESSLLTGIFHDFVAVRFSEDGRFLRYASLTSEDSEEWRFWERDVASGDERLVYEHTTRSDEIIPAGTFGDYYLILERDEEASSTITNLLRMDGTLEPVSTSTPDNPALVQRFGETLFIYNPFCEADCELRLKTVGGVQGPIYSMPDAIFPGLIIPLYQGDVLVQSSQATWILSENHAPELLGYHTSGTEFVPLTEADILSPDNRWIWLSDDLETPTELQLWDLENSVMVHSVAMTRIPRIKYGDHGVFVDANDDAPIYYRFEDGAEISLPMIEQGMYDTLLPDGTFLYYTSGDEPNIYHYDPSTDTHTLLFENMRLVFREDFEPPI